MTDAREALRETVARELANDMGEVVDRAWKFYLRGADAAIAIVLEEAASVAALFPAVTHGDLATDPHAAAAQAAQEIAAAILAMKGKP